MTDTASGNLHEFHNRIGLRTSLLSDAMDELGLPQNSTGGFEYLGAEPAVYGRAFTLRQRLVTDEDPPETVGRHGEAAARLCTPGDVLVIDSSMAPGIATWGSAHSLRAAASRLSGILVFGVVRDRAGLSDVGVPVSCRGFSPVRSKGRLATETTGCELDIDGLRIGPGDLVCFDADGVTVVPSAVEADVLAKAAEISLREAERDRQLMRGVR